MALIKCPECGKEISDKADICPNCNFNIVEYRIKEVEKEKKQAEEKKKELENQEECPECKKLVEKDTELCPFCGFPIRKEKNKQEEMLLEKQKRQKKYCVIGGGIVLIFALIIIISTYIKNNSVESKLIGQWSCSNSDATWWYEFNEDSTGTFLGYTEGSNHPAFTFDYVWTYDKDSGTVTITNIEKDKEQNSFDIIEFSDNDTIIADVWASGEKTLTKGYINVDSIVNEYATYDSEKSTESKYYPIGSDPEIGMSETDVKLSSWGSPDSINKTTTENGVHEQWVYGNGRYIYLDDGVVTAIQE